MQQHHRTAKANIHQRHRKNWASHYFFSIFYYTTSSEDLCGAKCLSFFINQINLHRVHALGERPSPHTYCTQSRQWRQLTTATLSFPTQRQLAPMASCPMSLTKRMQNCLKKLPMEIKGRLFCRQIAWRRPISQGAKVGPFGFSITSFTHLCMYRSRFFW